MMSSPKQSYGYKCLRSHSYFPKLQKVCLANTLCTSSRTQFQEQITHYQHQEMVNSKTIQSQTHTHANIVNSIIWMGRPEGCSGEVDQ